MQTSFSRPVGAWLCALGVCAAAFLYLWLRVDLSLLCGLHPRFPVFTEGWDSLAVSLSTPGGPTEYAAAYLSQFYHVALAGALILTAVAAFLALAMSALLTRLRAPREGEVSQGQPDPTWAVPPPGASAAPALLLIVLHSRYAHELTLGLVVLAAVALALAYTSAPPRSTPWRAAAFLGLSGLCYYLTAGGCLVFALLCAEHEILSQRHRLRALFCVFWAEAVPFVLGMQVLGEGAADAYLRLLPLHPGERTSATPWALLLLASVLVAPLLQAVWPRLVAQLPRRLTCERESAKSALLGVAAAAVLVLAFDDHKSTCYRADAAAIAGRWTDVLRETDSIAPERFTYEVLHNVNLALYHSGRLLDGLFSYPQTPDSLLVGMNADRNSAQGHELRTDLDFLLGEVELPLGLVNDAEHWAHEVLPLTGEHPRLLWRLSTINLAKGRTHAAQVFLRALARHPFWEERAERRLRKLRHGFPLNEEIAQIRSVMLPPDSGDLFQPFEAKCRKLLRRNPTNRMALEYLLASYLLAGRTEEVLKEFGQLSTLGYTTLPRHCEEAALVYEAETGRPGDLSGYEVSASARTRFRRFVEGLGPFRGATDLAPAWHALVRTHGDTYYFYHYLGGLGAMR